MAAVYIIFSSSLDSYYVGSCKDFHSRFLEHLNKKYDRSYTSKADDWKLFYIIEDLSYSQARSIETHIKKMKSRKYFENLLKYPEITKKLCEKYA